MRHEWDRTEMHTEVWFVKLKGEERLIFKWTSIKQERRAWARFMWLRMEWSGQLFVNMVMNFRVSRCEDLDKLKRQLLLKVRRHVTMRPSCGPSLLPCRHTAVFDMVHRTVTRGLTDPFCVSVQWLGHYNGRNEQRNEKREKKKRKNSTLYGSHLNNYLTQQNAGNLNILSIHGLHVHGDCRIPRSYAR